MSDLVGIREENFLTIRFYVCSSVYVSHQMSGSSQFEKSRLSELIFRTFCFWISNTAD